MFAKLFDFPEGQLLIKIVSGMKNHSIQIENDDKLEIFDFYTDKNKRDEYFNDFTREEAEEWFYKLYKE